MSGNPAGNKQTQVEKAEKKKPHQLLNAFLVSKYFASNELSSEIWLGECNATGARRRFLCKPDPARWGNILRSDPRSKRGVGPTWTCRAPSASTSCCWRSSLFPSCPPGPWVQLPCLCLECVRSPALAPLPCECVPSHPHNRASGCCLLPLYRCIN